MYNGSKNTLFSGIALGGQTCGTNVFFIILGGQTCGLQIWVEATKRGIPQRFTTWKVCSNRRKNWPTN